MFLLLGSLVLFFAAAVYWHNKAVRFENQIRSKNATIGTLTHRIEKQLVTISDKEIALLNLHAQREEDNRSARLASGNAESVVREMNTDLLDAHSRLDAVTLKLADYEAIAYKYRRSNGKMAKEMKKLRVSHLKE